MAAIDWQLNEEHARLGDMLGRADWLGGAAVVKKNRERTVYRLCLGGLDLHVKHLHPRGRLRAFLACFRGKAHRELMAIAAAFRRGLPVPEPVGWGREPGRGDEFVITRTIPAAMPFEAAWEDASRGADRASFVAALAALLDRLRVSCLWHPDMHAGNVLACRHDGRWSLALVDLYAARFTSSLSRHRRFQMALWLRPILIRLDAAERFELLRACGLAADAAALDDTMAEFHGRYLRRHRARWPGRRRRLLHEGSLCQARPGRHGQWLLRRPFPLDLAERVVDGCLAGLSSSTGMLKTDAKRSVARVAVGADSYVVKIFEPRSFRRSIAAARRSWLNSHRLVGMGLPVPRVYALCQAPDGGAFLMMEDLTAESLFRVLRRTEVLRTRRDLLRSSADLVARLHHYRVLHRDLKVSNLMPLPGREGRLDMAVLDLDTVSFPRHLTARLRAWNLRQLWVSMPPGVTIREALRFLILYGRFAGLSRTDVRLLLRRIAPRRRA